MKKWSGLVLQKTNPPQVVQVRECESGSGRSNPEPIPSRSHPYSGQVQALEDQPRQAHLGPNSLKPKTNEHVHLSKLA